MNGNVEKALRLIGAVDLQDVRLVSVGARNPRTPEEGADVELFVSHSSGVPNGHEQGANIQILVSLKARVANSAEDPNPYFDLSAKFELTYCVPEDFMASSEELRAFGDMNAVYNAWPYFRELTQSMSGRMGLPPIMLPVFRVGMAASVPEECEQAEDLPRACSV